MQTSAQRQPRTDLVSSRGGEAGVRVPFSSSRRLGERGVGAGVEDAGELEEGLVIASISPC